MSKYEYKDYKIRVSAAPLAEQSRSYDKTIVIENTNFNQRIEMDVEHCGKTQSILMISPYYTPVDSFVAPHQYGLFLMLNDTLCVFDPQKIEIIRKNTINPIGTMFAVYPYGEDYILYGELEIYRISSDLNMKWEFSGGDIFVRQQVNESAFEMKGNKICLYDFYDNYYEIDYDGKIIVDKPSEEWLKIIHGK